MFKSRIWNQYDCELFPGFYETYLNGDAYLEAYAEEQEEQFKPGTFCTYMRDVAAGYVRHLDRLAKEELPEFVRNLELDALNSPEYYNFETDRLLIRLEVDEDAVLREIRKNEDDFNRYLQDHYTSHDGCIWFIRNTLEELYMQPQYFWNVALDYLFSRLEFFQGDYPERDSVLEQIVGDVIWKYLEPVKGVAL